MLTAINGINLVQTPRIGDSAIKKNKMSDCSPSFSAKTNHSQSSFSDAIKVISFLSCDCLAALSAGISVIGAAAAIGLGLFSLTGEAPVGLIKNIGATTVVALASTFAFVKIKGMLRP